MNSLLLNNSTKKPKYQLLADTLRQQIMVGTRLPSDKLPTFAEMEQEYGYSQNTVDKAYAILEKEGLIFREPGQGVYISGLPQKATSTGLVGYVDDRMHRSLDTQYYTQIFNGVLGAAAQANKQLVVIPAFNKFKNWELLEGVVFCAGAHHFTFSPDDFLPYMPAAIPIVNLLLPLKDMPSVYPNDAQGIKLLLDHLFALGHTRISFLSQLHFPLFSKHPSLLSRYEAFVSKFHTHRLAIEDSWFFSPSAFHEPDYIHYGYQGMKEWLEKGWSDLNTTALICQNDECAVGAIRALEEHGLNVPEDISVAGYDGINTVETMPYELTTIEIPAREIGMTGFEMLQQAAQRPQRIQQSIVLPTQLKVGKTTARPRRQRTP